MYSSSLSEDPSMYGCQIYFLFQKFNCWTKDVSYLTQKSILEASFF